MIFLHFKVSLTLKSMKSLSEEKKFLLNHFYILEILMPTIFDMKQV